MQSILNLDRNLLYLINSFGRNQLTDVFAMILSGSGSYGIIWIIIAVFIFVREEKKDHHFLRLVFFTLGASYTITELILKPIFGRVRPEAIEGVYMVLESTNDSFSFPSGHATIAFAAAVILSSKEPKVRIWIFILAFLIAWSRIYLGRHYPLDVIAGGVIGYSIGLWLMILSKKYFNNVKNHKIKKFLT